MVRFLDEQFDRLLDAIKTVKTFWFNDTQQYLGPLNPVGIIQYFHTDINKTHNWLVLCEHVPIRYLPFDPKDLPPTAIVMAALDENYAFVDFDIGRKNWGKLDLRFVNMLRWKDCVMNMHNQDLI